MGKLYTVHFLLELFWLSYPSDTVTLCFPYFVPNQLSRFHAMIRTHTDDYIASNPKPYSEGKASEATKVDQTLELSLR